MYRLIQIHAVKWLTKSLKKNSGLYLCAASYGAYFGYFRQKWMFVQPESEHDKKKTMIEVQAKKADRAWKDLMKYLMYDLVFSNSYIDELTGKAIYDLTQEPKYQNLVTDLFLLMYSQKGFVSDTQSLTANIINDYLASQYCLGSMSNLVVEQVLHNEETVLPGIQTLLMNYLRDDYKNLDNLFSQMLINVGWNDAVQNAMYKTLNDQVNEQLMGPTIYDLAVINLLQSLGQEREQVETELKQRAIMRQEVKDANFLDSDIGSTEK